MENAEEKISEKYVKGFNDGYIISKHEPELMEKLLESEIPDQEYKKALEAGERQNQKEMLINQMKHQTQSKNKSKDRGF
tara:strand:- start:424 stop:660 length:237 start_codon:yes stop_codon:yes gene_type:complete